jgi:hypothetical protein
MLTIEDLAMFSVEELLDEVGRRQDEAKPLTDWVAQAASSGRYTGSWSTHLGLAQELIHFDSRGILWAFGPRVLIHPIALDHYVTTGEACGFWPWNLV